MKQLGGSSASLSDLRTLMFRWEPLYEVPGPGAKLFRISSDVSSELLRHTNFKTWTGREIHRLIFEAHKSGGPIAVFSFQIAVPMALVIVQLGEIPLNIGDRISVYTRVLHPHELPFGHLYLNSQRQLQWALQELGLEEGIPDTWPPWPPGIAGQQVVPGDFSSWRMLGVPVPPLYSDPEFVQWLQAARADISAK